jgi:hypothetical protein
MQRVLGDPLVVELHGVSKELQMVRVRVHQQHGGMPTVHGPWDCHVHVVVSPVHMVWVRLRCVAGRVLGMRGDLARHKLRCVGSELQLVWLRMSGGGDVRCVRRPWNSSEVHQVDAWLHVVWQRVQRECG